jgi:hypothetical protein
MEKIYESMNSRNIWYKTKPVVNSKIEEGHCVAAYALGDWSLQPAYPRLLKRLQDIIGDAACFYSAAPQTNQGLLHQTLLQFIKFDSYPHDQTLLLQAMECVADVIAKSQLALWITYKGLVWTPTGLALAGTCENEELVLQVRREMQAALQAKDLPCDIPYFNDILHATVLRWVKQPDALTLVKLEKEVERWSECVLGEVRIKEWRVGKGSWRMQEKEREDYFAVPVQQHICHRGNLHGANPKLENNFGILIQRAIQGYHVELDVWYIDEQLWLGHDKPDHKISLEWLASNKRRLIHAKDGPAFEYLLREAGKRGLDLHVFYHTEEDYVLTNKGLIICYPGKPLLQGSLCMMPERASYSSEDLRKSFSLCSDSKDGVSSYSDY